MRWVVNSAVIPAGGFGTYTYDRLTWGELSAWLHADRFRSCVGYTGNQLKILEMTGVHCPISRDPSPMKPGDEAAVVRLRFRVDDPHLKGELAIRDDEWEVGLLCRLR